MAMSVSTTLYAVWVLYPKGPVLHTTCLTPWRAENEKLRMEGNLSLPTRIVPYSMDPAEKEYPL